MKKIISVLLLCALTFAAFADINVYTGMSKSTSDKIAAADALIAKNQFASAYETLNSVKADEFILAKKVEIVINYFISSNLHLSFELGDIGAGKTILEARAEGKKYKSYALDPVQEIADYEKANGTKPILQKSLGDYYYDISVWFGDGWSISYAELLAKAADAYKNAYEAKTMNGSSLDNYGSCLLALGDLDNAIKVLEYADSVSDFAGINYNLAVAQQYVGNYEDAAKNALIAAKNYSTDNIDYKMDAYVLAADINLNMDKVQDALNILAEAMTWSDTDYRVYQKLMAIYLWADRTDLAAYCADSIFALYPDNPSSTQLILSVFYNYTQDFTLVEQFFSRNMKTFSGNNMALANLNYYLAMHRANMNDENGAKAAAKDARTYFIAAGQYQGGVKASLDSFLGL